ncbi:hypothetical protein FRC19_008496 [Serendipita sp. 401]|nr:hypothetical protein FRC19_008496 [Serendipita sp. 401]
MRQNHLGHWRGGFTARLGAAGCLLVSLDACWIHLPVTASCVAADECISTSMTSIRAILGTAIHQLWSQQDARESDLLDRPNVPSTISFSSESCWAPFAFPWLFLIDGQSSFNLAVAPVTMDGQIMLRMQELVHLLMEWHRDGLCV